MSPGREPAGIDAVKEVFDEHVESYSAEIEKALGPLSASHDFFMRHKAELIRDFLSRHFPGKRTRILDAGCGMGLMHAYLDDPTIELHGLDISAKALEFAARKHPHVSYHHEESARFPFEDGEFDLVFATNVLHHVPVPMWRGFAGEMGRVAGQGRFVMIVEHNPFNPATRWVVHTCEIDKDAVLLTPRTAKRLLQGAGLAVAQKWHILFTPFEAPFFRRLDGWLSWFPMGAQYVMVGQKTSTRRA